MKSTARELCEQAAASSDPMAWLEAALSELAPIDLAALAHDWSFWARPAQVVPQGRWRSHGFLTGRGFGKTRANAEFVIGEVRAGRAGRIGFMAQTEDKAIEVLIEGDSGLIACSPPWFAPRWERGRLAWPNGAQAFPFSPERPGNVRGPGVHLMWLSEVQSWPSSTREEAFHNAALMTRLGYGKTIWEATAKRRHPLLRMLLRDAEYDPAAHLVSRGRSDDNADNLAPGVLDDLRSRLQGTQRGLEELDGIFSDDDAGALFRQEWIDRARRDLPRDMRRRVIAIDPAITSRKGSDQTGVSECGLGHDGQVYVIGDYTDRYRPEEWGDVVLDRYVAGACDCVIAETNRGGELVVSNLRARGESRQRIETGTTLRVLQLEEEAPTRHVNGVVYVKVVHARKGKDERAGPVASLYEQGKCSHVRGAKLDELEDTLCTWEPDVKNDSPDRMDPMVWAVWELAGLRREQRTDTRSAVQAAAAAMKLIRPEMPTALGALLRGGPQRGRI